MAKLPSQKRVNKEDVKDAPQWIDAIIIPLNTFMESIYSAVNQNLTFQENIRSQIRTVSFTTSATYTSGAWTNINFSSGLRGIKTQGILVLQILNTSVDNFTPLKQAVTCDWYDNSGTITIYYVTGLANSTTYTMRVLVF
jgi:hypothetical protein